MGTVVQSTLQGKYKQAIKVAKNRIFCAVQKNRQSRTRVEKQQLRANTYLYQVRDQWKLKTSGEKLDWKNAGTYSGKTGYNLYVQDKSYRIKNSIAGEIAPSNYHQYKIGHINFTPTANNIYIREEHIENFTLPITFSVSSWNSLQHNIGEGYLYIKLILATFYGGQVTENEFRHELELGNDNWVNQTMNISTLQGDLGYWRIEIQGADIWDDLYFDNLQVLFGGQLRNNDPLCEKFPLYWKNSTDYPDNTQESIYCPDSINI